MSFKAMTASAILQTCTRSVRFRFVLDDARSAPQRMGTPGLYVFWHEMLLVAACALSALVHRAPIVPVISRGRDGALADEVIHRLGGRTIRGSTDHDGKNRGGRTALREMLRQGRQHHLGLALDGPVGPSRRTISPGVAFAASRAGMPVIPLGIAVRTSIPLGRGERAIHLPVLFSQAWFVLGRPLQVPSNLSRSDIKEFVEPVQSAMDDVQTRAEAYARGAPPPMEPITLREMAELV